MIVTSPLLAAIPNLHHGFSTRLGGVSEGPYATLNLGEQVGDAPEAVRENRRRFVAALVPGVSGLVLHLALAEANQVHGARILEVTEAGTHDADADALVTDAPRIAVAVRTADCAPLLLAALDADGNAQQVAAVHAGWRGATAGIAGAAVAHLAARAPARIVAAIGPTIGVEDFEVGDEVVAAARASLAGDEPPTRPGQSGKRHLDLVSLLVLQLERAGVAREHIDAVGGSTSDASRYFSHRRDRGVTGRHLSAIALVPASLRQ